MEDESRKTKAEKVLAAYKERYRDVADKTPQDLGLSPEVVLEFVNSVVTILDKKGCNDSREKPISRKVLETMGVPQDVADQFLRLCEYRGGICDCKLCIYIGEVIGHGPDD
ncbi:MAG: hypothetical protein JXD19_00075 [Deltaproteobacteria bacterium]|nr:hypothetical protein [Deltaproteobacteria bacterium]